MSDTDKERFCCVLDEGWPMLTSSITRNFPGYTDDFGTTANNEGLGLE